MDIQYFCDKKAIWLDDTTVHDWNEMIKFATGYKNKPEKDMYNAREVALRRNQVKKYSLYL